MLAAGCQGVPGLGPISKTSQHGYVVPDMALEQIPLGSSKDQVLIALGSPSTTGDFGGEVFYYISQTRKQSVAFMPRRSSTSGFSPSISTKGIGRPGSPTTA